MKMKVALVYDRVNKWGGAEKILLALHRVFPNAPLYTSVYDSIGASWAKVFEVRTSFLQKIPFFRVRHEWLAFLMPLAFESFNFDGYDLVISVTSEAAKGIITKPKTTHICYCLTPTRYLWSGHDKYLGNVTEKGIPGFLFGNTFYKIFIKYLKRWDRIAANRPDKYIAISKTVAERIRKYYGREAEVVYPPVMKSSKFKVQSSKRTQATPYFLVVSRLVPYKRVDLAIEACAALGWDLKIAGIGNEEERLKKMAKGNDHVEFLGLVLEEKLRELYQNCAAVIFPGEEDFGLVPLEAASYGRPVVAYRGGGALETVVEGKTGAFFYPQTAEALTERLKNFKQDGYDRKDCQNQAAKFSEEIFENCFLKTLKEVCEVW